MLNNQTKEKISKGVSVRLRIIDSTEKTSTQIGTLRANLQAKNVNTLHNQFISREGDSWHEIVTPELKNDPRTGILLRELNDSPLVILEKS